MTFEQYCNEATQQYDKWEQALQSNEMLATARQLLLDLQALEPHSENLIVGGAVRDLILGKEPHDVDLATSIDIDKIQKHFQTADIGKSKDFGIVTVQYGGHNFEIAHFREESGSTDSRHPDHVSMIRTFEGDANRRDITINSLGITANGSIIDYTGGLGDLQGRIIKAVGDPALRILEDSLRMLRILRFAASLGFSIDSKTQQAIIHLKHTIDKVAPERIKDELFKTAKTGQSLARFIEYLDETGLLEIILPEVKALQSAEHTIESHPEGAWIEE